MLLAFLLENPGLLLLLFLTILIFGKFPKVLKTQAKCDKCVQ